MAIDGPSWRTTASNPRTARRQQRLFPFRASGRLARLWRGSCHAGPPQGTETGRLSMLSRRLFATSAAATAGASALLAGAAQAQQQPAESTMDRVKRTKILRIAALPGEAPYFNKDIATGEWSGMCIEMAKNIAGVFDGKVEYL